MNRISILLLLTVIIALILSCNKDEVEPVQPEYPKYFTLCHPEFKGDVRCYDTGTVLFEHPFIYNTNKYVFLHDDNDYLYYYDSYAVPSINKIEIKDDSSALFYYKIDRAFEVLTGEYLAIGDTLLFYIHSREYYDEPFFKGIIDNNKLKTPAYGYVYGDYYSFEPDRVKKNLGEPNIIELTEKMRDDDYYDMMYIQEYDLVYDIVDEEAFYSSVYTDTSTVFSVKKPFK